MISPLILALPLGFSAGPYAGAGLGKGVGQGIARRIETIATNLFEYLLPDVRLEWGADDGAGLLLTRPLTWSILPRPPDDDWRIARLKDYLDARETARGLGEWHLQAIVEPQWQVTDDHVRAVMAMRTVWLFDTLGPMLEGGGVVGSDGHGAMVGLGIFRGQPDKRGMLFSVRSTWADGWRADVALSVEVPLSAL